MTECNNPEIVSISKLFEAPTKYIIPIYQRNYAWTQVEIEQLLEDINDFQDESYYLGSLIVNKREREDNTYEVIDGQQRLTTLFLLVSFLGKNPKEDTLRFDSRDNSNNTLNAICLNKNLNDDSYSQEIITGLSIIKQYFEKKNASITASPTFQEVFIDKLNKVSLVRTQVPEKIDLNHYFEVMNTRGEQLEAHEILKARIISNINDKAEQKVAAMIWDACSQMDKYVQMNFISDLRNVLFDTKDNLNFKCASFDSIYTCFKNSTINEKSKLIPLQQDNKISLEYILKGEPKSNSTINKSDEESVRFESIISFSYFLLHVNALTKDESKDGANTQSNLDDKKLLELIECSDDKKAKEFIYNLLKYRFLFDKYIIKREYISSKNSDGWSLKKIKYENSKISYVNTIHDVDLAYKKATDIPTDLSTDLNPDIPSKDDDYSIYEYVYLLQSCLRITYTSPKTMDWLTIALITINKNASSKENNNDKKLFDALLQELEKYCCKNVNDSNYLKKTGFAIERIVFTYLDYLLVKKYNKNKKDIQKFITSVFKKLESTNEEFSKIRTCFKNLESINEELTNLNKCFHNYEFQYRTSIEHFFPQNPDKDGSNKVELKDHFGNLALITVSANSKFSNLTPIAKIEKEKLMQLSPKLALMGFICKINEGKWTDALIEYCGSMMFEILNDD